MPSAAKEADELPMLDKTPVPTEVPSIKEPEKMTIWSYTNTSLSNFNHKDDDIDFDGDFDSGGALHTFGVTWKGPDERLEKIRGQGLSYGYSDEVEFSGAREIYGGYGQINASLRRHEFEWRIWMTADPGIPDSGIPMGGGYFYTQTKIEHDFTRISGPIVSQSFETRTDCYGMSMGPGNNHPLFKDSSLVTLYWSAHLLVAVAWRSIDEIQSLAGNVEKDEETFFACGGRGTLGLQMHLGDNFTIGAGYKGHYLAGGPITESYHGLMASAMIRF
jgi:hypothetical protein